MAGLIDPTAVQQPPARTPNPDTVAETDAMQPQGEGQAATPEEQEIYDQLVGNAIAMMIEGEDDGAQIRPAIMQRLQATGEPVADVANTAVVMISALVQSAGAAGQPIPDDVLMHAGKEIIEILVQAAEQAGIHEFSADEMEGAFYQALDLYREQGKESGAVDDAALKQGWQEIVTAEQQGQLDALLPGIGQAAARGGDGGQGAPVAAGMEG